MILVAMMPATAFAQGSILQGGPFEAGHAPMYSGSGSSTPVVIDSGPAGGSSIGVGLSELLLVARGNGTTAAPYAGQGTGPLGTIDCQYDAPITNPTGYHYLCFSPNAQGGALIATGSGGGAVDQPLNISVNGTLIPLGGTSITVGTTLVSSGTDGYLLYDNAGVLGNFNLFGGANTWTGAQALTGGATVPTRSPGDATTNAASTAFVQAAVGLGSLTVGGTPILGGTAKGILYNDTGVLGNAATTNSGIVTTSATGLPLVVTTLPAANLPAFSGGDVTSTVGSTTLTIGASRIQNAMIANGVIDLSTKVTGTLPATSLPAFSGGNVTSSAGSAVLTIGASQVTNTMLAGSIDLTTKVTGALPIANGGCAATTAATCLSNIGALPLAGGTMGGLLILSGDPVASLGAATKQYVDSLASGLQVKASVAVATTANITLSGEQTIDGVLTSTSRVLVKNQSTAANNGIYVSAAGAWARATDLDAWSEAVGAYTLVTAGTANGSTGWTTQVSAGGTIGVTSMPWAQFSASTNYTAGAGLTLGGTSFSVSTGGVTNAMLAGSIDLATKVTGALPTASLPAFSGGDVTSSAGTASLAIGAGKVSNTMLAGSIAASKLIGSDIATVGTISTGTWHGTAIGTQYGGTGQDWSASTGIPLITAGIASLLGSSGSGNVARVTAPTIASLTVTGAFTATGLVTNADLANSSTTLGVTALTLGATADDLTFANNHVIAWRNSGGTPINAAYLDGSNIFQLGGGANINITASASNALTVAGGAALGGNLAIATNKFTVASASGNTAIAGTLATSGVSSLSSGTNTFALYVNGNTNAAYPTANFGIAMGVNFSFLDAAFFNTFTTATRSFGFYQQTGASSANLLLALNASGSIGFGTAFPETIGSSVGAGVGISGGVGILHVNPPVDSNDTTVALVVQVNDQAGAATYGGTGYETAIQGGIYSTHNTGSLAPNKVGVSGMGAAIGATSGNVWGGYFECKLDVGSNANSFCLGTEIDVNNYSVDKGNDLAHPAYGLQISGNSDAGHRSTSAIFIGGTVNQWARGISFANLRNGVTDYGIDLAFDASNTFTNAAIRIPNNQTVVWKTAGGSNINALYLDGAGAFNVGGGLPTQIASLLNITSNNGGSASLFVQNTHATAGDIGMTIANGANSSGDTSSVMALFAYSNNGTVVGSITRAAGNTVSYNTSSDARLKTVLGNAKGCLAEISRVKVRDFVWKADTQRQVQRGYIAQELEAVFPQAVHVGGESPQTAPWGVDYGKLTPLDTCAIQELKADNDNLRARLDRLERRAAK